MFFSDLFFINLLSFCHKYSLKGGYICSIRPCLVGIPGGGETLEHSFRYSFDFRQQIGKFVHAIVPISVGTCLFTCS